MQNRRQVAFDMGWQTVDVLLLKSIDGRHVAFDVGWQTVDVLLWFSKKRLCTTIDSQTQICYQIQQKLAADAQNRSFRPLIDLLASQIHLLGVLYRKNWRNLPKFSSLHSPTDVA